MSQSFTPPVFPLNPTIISSDYDQTSVKETAGLRYTKIPYTALFADAQLEEQRIGQFDQLSSLQDIEKSEFLQQTVFRSLASDVRAGFNVSPWQKVSLSAHYRRHEDDSHYDNAPLVQPLGNVTAYPGFIRSRDVVTDEVEGKLVLHPCTWFKTTLTYQIQSSDYFYRNGTCARHFSGWRPTFRSI